MPRYVQDNTGRLLKEMAAARDDLDSLFAELDTSLAQSRQIFSQVAVKSNATSDSAARNSNAAVLTVASHAASVPSAAQSTITGLEVPAYVHVGDPLVSDEPAMAATACIHEVHW